MIAAKDKRESIRAVNARWQFTLRESMVLILVSCVALTFLSRGWESILEEVETLSANLIFWRFISLMLAPIAATLSLMGCARANHRDLREALYFVSDTSMAITFLGLFFELAL